MITAICLPVEDRLVLSLQDVCNLCCHSAITVDTQTCVNPAGRIQNRPLGTMLAVNAHSPHTRHGRQEPSQITPRALGPACHKEAANKPARGLFGCVEQVPYPSVGQDCLQIAAPAARSSKVSPIVGRFRLPALHSRNVSMLANARLTCSQCRARRRPQACRHSTRFFACNSSACTCHACPTASPRTRRHRCQFEEERNE